MSSPPDSVADGSAFASSAPKPVVLLVDDSPVAREKIGAILNDIGCVVLAAVNGIQGLQLAKDNEGRLALVILDIQMPRMGGISTLRYLRRIPALDNTPVIMLTTLSDSETVRTALAYKANDFIRKDSSIAAITERLRANLPGRDQPAPKDTAGIRRESVKIARSILRGQRPSHSAGPAPWVLFFEARADLSDMIAGLNLQLVRFYSVAVRSLDRFNRSNARIEAGYRVEYQQRTVSEIPKSSHPPTLLMVSGRQPEGVSLARMAATMQGPEYPVYLITESDNKIPADQRNALEKAGVQMIQRRLLTLDRLVALFSSHILLE